MTWKDLASSGDAWVFTVAFAALFPPFGYWHYRRLARHPAAAVPQAMKLGLYGSIVSAQWILTAAMLLLVRAHGLSLADAGERVGHAPLTLGLAAFLLAAVAILLPINLRNIRRAPVDRLEAMAQRLRKFLPGSPVEQAAFALMALTAGICEELLYRGWLVNLLGAATGSLWAGVALGALAFGFGHAYQGPKGILMTGVAGLVLGALFVLTGSLVPGQAAHAAIDLASGFAGAAVVSRLRSPDDGTRTV